KIKAISENVDENDLPDDVAGLKEYHRKLTLGLTLPNATDKNKNRLDNNSQAEKENIPYKDIVDYLNEKAERQFKMIDKTKTLIKSRWNEGQRLDDFKKVIDIKIKHANDPNNLFNSK